MELRIGQKVAYPNQGVCRVEEIEPMKLGGASISCYFLRVLGDNSSIMIPVTKVDSVGLRPVIGKAQYHRLIINLGADFEDVPGDWKTRSRVFQEKLQTGDVFEAADVLKKLTFLSHEKKLSFREQTMLEKARFLILSEINNSDWPPESQIELKISKLVEKACSKHLRSEPAESSATLH